MQISKNKVVAIDYTLTDDDGNTLDTSANREPLKYIQGAGNIIPGLERALEGEESGSQVNVTVQPDEGYGQRDENLKQQVPRNLFEGVDTLEPGMQFQAQTEGGVQIITVAEVGDEQVLVDANHPLAGVTLNFDVNVVEVRDATEEELEHGHVHG
ncbi:peptidylprolyl isomerase [Ectothiorhodospiraceae bacterium WFHF3C12]|nr:peptidylprolyl isomerase [Ectothiorhodospiraceae bacterium WFHF3C12]